jgi:hypothetical protein
MNQNQYLYALLTFLLAPLLVLLFVVDDITKVFFMSSLALVPEQVCVREVILFFWLTEAIGLTLSSTAPKTFAV